MDQSDDDDGGGVYNFSSFYHNATSINRVTLHQDKFVVHTYNRTLVLSHRLRLSAVRSWSLCPLPI